MTKITIGARSSKLSLAYVAKVKELLLKNNNDLKEENINFKAIKTSGDLNLNKNISEIGGKNLFCKEIEESLLKKEIDIAVHSLKDMEANENESLLIGAYLKRNDYRDVIISEKIKNISDLKSSVKIGSSSKRRELQLKKINSNISVINIRGNIDTRINKINENKLDGVILAAAGVKSLKLDKKISFTFNCDHILPAVGQVIIAVQCIKEDKIKNLRPPIFWKDKNTFVNQAKLWNSAKIKNMLKATYELEIRFKSNSNINNNVIIKKLILDICECANF